MAEKTLDKIPFEGNRRTYRLTCVVCGEPFEAKLRTAGCCSKKCWRRLNKGVTFGGVVPGDRNSSVPPSTPPPVSQDTRLYALYRGTLARPDWCPVGQNGKIESGPFEGRQIREMLKTAARVGWLAYLHRSNEWYSAEWWLERKLIALCGPCSLPHST